MKRNLLIFWNVVILIPIAAVILLAVMLLGFRIVGLQVFTVDSPSMEPAALRLRPYEAWPTPTR